MTFALGFGLALGRPRRRPVLPPGAGAPANAILNNQGGYVRNASGGYVLKDAS